MSTRKTASKNKPSKKATARTAKVASKRTSKAKASTKKASTKKASPRKAVVKKASAKKVAKKVAKKAAKKKAIVKRKAILGKKATAKKAAAKKATAKKGASKKVVAKKATARKATTKKAAAKKATTAKKGASKKTASRNAAAKKVSAKAKVTAKKVVAKKTSPKKVVAKKVSPKKSAPAAPAPKKSAGKMGAKKAVARKAASERPPVGAVRTTVAPSRLPKVELTPRSSASVAPTIPIPVKEVPRRPTLEERAKSVEERILRQSVDFRERYDESFNMSWIYHGTALEGIVYTFDELTTAFRSDEVTVVDSSVMPIYDAIRRHKEAIAHVREQADKRRSALTVESLKQIYIVLHPEEGDVKTVKYRRDVPQHRLYFHDYAQPDKIAYKVRQVIDWVNNPENAKNVGVLRVAAKAHYDLARAYPFAMSSGKVARLFMNLILMRSGFPPAIIHATERQRYYEALKANTPANLVQMLRDSVDNAVSSIEKLLDQHEARTTGFVS